MSVQWRAAAAAFRVLPASTAAFSLRQALTATVCGSLEWMERHFRLLQRLEALRSSRHLPTLGVLDFGGAAGALAKAATVHGIGHRYAIVVTDVDEVGLRQAPRLPAVWARVRTSRAGLLPFGDDAFHAAVSSDVFEHIPVTLRGHWAAELDRVSRHGQLHTVPCASADGRFDGRRADRLLQEWHMEAFGRLDAFTAEHEREGLPTPEELARLFPRARLTGFANAAAWLELMKEQLADAPFFRRLQTSVRYVRQYQAVMQPPFKNCLVDALDLG